MKKRKEKSESKLRVNDFDEERKLYIGISLNGNANI